MILEILKNIDHILPLILRYGDPSFSVELNSNRLDSSNDYMLTPRKYKSAFLQRPDS